MNLKKKEKILLGVLSSVVIFYFFDMFVLSKKEEVKPVKSKIEKRNETSKVSSSGLNSNTALSINRNNVKKISSNRTIDPKLFSKWKRDPFLGAFTSELLDSLQKRERVEFELKGISWRDSIAYVIINDDVYRKGESKNGIHVIDIMRDKVIISSNGLRSTLMFGEQNEN